MTVDPSGVATVEGDTLIAGDGSRQRAEVIAVFTGFRTHDFLPDITVKGRDVQRYWAAAGGPQEHRGMALPGFPNLFLVYDPNTNFSQNSIVFMIECPVHYILQAIRALGQSDDRSTEVTEDAAAAVDAALRGELAGTAWAGGCSNRYKTAQGRIVNNWSNNTVKCWWRTRRLRPSDYQLI